MIGNYIDEQAQGVQAGEVSHYSQEEPMHGGHLHIDIHRWKKGKQSSDV